MKLNLGDGGLEIPGYTPLDIKRGECISPLPLFTEPIEEIRASHVLEHFPRSHVQPVVNDWVQRLQPGGWLKIAVPDFGKIARWYIEDRDNPERDLIGYLMGGQVDEDDYHTALFDERLLTETLQRSGLVNIQHWESEIKDCAALEVSLNLMGQKPDTMTANYGSALPKPKAGEIIAVMTAPRLGFLENAMCWARALVPLGIEINKTGGVFWGQGLTMAFERRLDAGAKYFLTMDYDSVFDREDVQRMYDIMERREDIDALAAVQTRREMVEPLLTIPKEQMSEPGKAPFDYFASETAELCSAHFGLTMLRVEKLRALSKPWFHAIPDAEGRWGDGRMDEDVAFWHKWRAEGNTIHLACRVPIGHVQAVVTFPSEQMDGRHQHLRDYEKNGKPTWIWK